MIYSHEFRIGLDDIREPNIIKDKSILRFMENIACYHTDDIGGGVNSVNAVTESGRAWALLDWELKIVKRPEYGCKIKVDTWGRKITRAYVYRDFAMYADGELVAMASSRWFCLDTAKRRPMRIDSEEMIPYESESTSILGIDEIGKIYEQDAYDETFTYHIHKSEYDVFHHLHNTCYLDAIYEQLTDEEINKISHIRITYKKEISNKEELTVKKLFLKDENKYCFAITTDNDTVINTIAELD